MATYTQAYITDIASGDVYAVQYRDDEIITAAHVDDWREITDEALDGWIGNVSGDDNVADWLNERQAATPEALYRLCERRYNAEADALLTPAEAKP